MIYYNEGDIKVMSSITKYEHHGVEVFADSETKGKHQSVCLCYKGCKRFNPGHADNCEIAQSLFENCKKYNVTTPVFECPKYLS